MTTPGTKPELVFALVGGAGVPLDDLRNELRRALESFDYQCDDISVSALLQRFKQFSAPPAHSECPEYTRITHLQKVAFQVRTDAGAEALARAAMVAIREKRKAVTQDPDKPAPGRAYILQQLKHPKEVALLRQV